MNWTNWNWSRNWRRSWLKERATGERHRAADVSDARPATDRPIGEDVEAQRKRKRSLRMFAASLGVVGAVGSLTAIFGQGGYLEMRRLRHDLAVLRSNVEDRRLRVRQLEDERDRLQIDPLAQERIARERLGLIKPGEIDFLLPRDPDPSARRQG